jgi:RNA polymerase sigma-70 factor, ECF subfamily
MGVRSPSVVIIAMAALAEQNIFEPYYQSATLVKHTMNLSVVKSKERIIEELFKKHFSALHAYACILLKDHFAAEEAVQNIFMRLLEQVGPLNEDANLRAYLYRGVHNECLNQLKHQKVKNAYQAYKTREATTMYENASEKIIVSELQNSIREAIDELPDQCRNIFQLSRYQELKYHEIATVLNLSVKTVENQMGKALKLLRNKLAGYLPTLFVLFLQFQNIIL